MLKIIENGIIYNGKTYLMSLSDLKWVIEQNKKYPMEHPARNLKSVAYEIIED